LNHNNIAVCHLAFVFFWVVCVQKDLFGDVAEAKEVNAFAASYKEAKRCRANDTFKLLASLVTRKMDSVGQLQRI